MAYKKKGELSEEFETVNESNLFNSDVAETGTDAGVIEAQVTQPRVGRKAAKRYDNDTLVPCRSIVQGYLNYKGTKSGTVYQWGAINDVTNLEYQDLKSALLSRSSYITRPYFIIEDEELLQAPEWKDVRDIYENMYSKKDLTEIFKISDPDHMGRVLEGLPEGVKKQMGNIAKEMMKRGTLDSIRKIKKIDEVLGTDLKLFLTQD